MAPWEACFRWHGGQLRAGTPEETVLHPDDFEAFIDLLEIDAPADALVNAATRRGSR